MGAGVHVDGVAQLGGETKQWGVLLALEGAVDKLAFGLEEVSVLTCIGLCKSGGSPASLVVADILRLVVTTTLG
jgi:hypothetical protein